MKASEKNTEKDTQKEGTEQPVKKGSGELKTDYPMSEKDEVKQAEQNTKRQQNEKR